MARRLGFVQLEVAGPPPIDAGRYLIAEPKCVVVVSQPGAPVARVKPRRRLRREHPQLASEPVEAASPPPTTRWTVVEPEPLAGDAEEWLERLTDDRDASATRLAEGTRLINHVLRAHRDATLDRSLHELSPARALVRRIGYASPEEAADGLWEGAYELPVGDARHQRGEALRSRERVAGLLAGREALDPAAAAALRAREDLDDGRVAEAAAQLDVALRFLGSAAIRSDTELEQASGLVAEVVARLVREGGGASGAEDEARLDACLALVERFLRRRRASGA